MSVQPSSVLSSSTIHQVGNVKLRPRTRHVKSGCRTCKVRHVKCDEEKPACRKCRTSGRICDGYGIFRRAANLSQPKSEQTGLQALCKQKSLPLNRNPAPFPGVAREERSYLDYFCNAPTLKLAGIFQSEFWSSLVLQVSAAESGLLHAIVALASAHRYRFPTSETEYIVDPKSYDSFTLLQYNKAIKDLNAHMSTQDPTSIRIAAISSVVFMCLEILRGEYHVMNTHFQHGIKLLRHIQIWDRHHQHKHGIIIAQDPRSLDDHLVCVFTRLRVQFLMFGYGPLHKRASFAQDFHCGRSITIPRLFATIRELRQSLDNILNLVVHLVVRFQEDFFATDIHPPRPTPASLQRQADLQVTISDWTAAYHVSTPSLLLRASTHERLGLRMLQIYGHLVSVMLSTCFSVKETTFDSYNSMFESIVRESEDLVRLAATMTPGTKNGQQVSHRVDTCQTTSSFSIDMGCYPPLYYTALKCRIPHLRRRAVTLLKMCQHTEGPWTGPLLAHIATCAIDMEEADFSATLHTLPVPSEIPKPAQMSTSASSISSSKLSSPTSVKEKPFSAPSSSSPQILFKLPEFSRLHCVRCVLPQKCHPMGSIGKGDKKKALGTLIFHRFRHELGQRGGWDVKKYDIDFQI